MRKPITLLASLGIALALSGCNSMDDLTPQVDVGGGTFNSPPVNQTDLDAMSQQSAGVVPQATTPVQSTQLASPEQEGFAEGPSGTVLAQGDAEYTDPPGSLDAQAGRLQQGQIPAQQRIARRAVLAESTSLDEAAPAEQRQESAAPLRNTEETAEVQKPQKAAAIAPAATAGTIRFLPIIGAPVEAVTPLSKQLGNEARSHGLTIKAASDTSSQHILKGYFSALNDGGKTTVVYVWDVLDGTGSRLHRIQGQDTVDATAADLWSVVPPQTMQAIATKTIAEYLDWRAKNAG
jgi:hypothetical protein